MWQMLAAMAASYLASKKAQQAAREQSAMQSMQKLGGGVSGPSAAEIGGAEESSDVQLPQSTPPNPIQPTPMLQGQNSLQALQALREQDRGKGFDEEVMDGLANLSNYAPQQQTPVSWSDASTKQAYDLGVQDDYWKSVEASKIGEDFAKTQTTDYQPLNSPGAYDQAGGNQYGYENYPGAQEQDTSGSNETTMQLAAMAAQYGSSMYDPPPSARLMRSHGVSDPTVPDARARLRSVLARMAQRRR